MFRETAIEPTKKEHEQQQQQSICLSSSWYRNTPHNKLFRSKRLQIAGCVCAHGFVCGNDHIAIGLGML